MDCCVKILNRRNRWSTADQTMTGGAPFGLNKYISRTRFEGVLGPLHYKVQNDVGYYDAFFHMRKIEEAWNLNMAE